MLAYFRKITKFMVIKEFLVLTKVITQKWKKINFFAIELFTSISKGRVNRDLHVLYYMLNDVYAPKEIKGNKIDNYII